ncbi:MAG: hypothetical protein GF311_10555 [Candidatus Lokiarchaeota archaeon]|nr:hypothetical protein [Candidatus Lokiarchaeota archaeon]
MLRYFFRDKHSREFSRHRYLYDYDMLKGILMDIGFKQVDKCAYRQGRVPDISILDNNPEESLYIEAIK